MKFVLKTLAIIYFILLSTQSNLYGQQKDYSISGYFYNINSLPRTPIENGIIEIYDSNTVIFETHSDSIGHYEFNNLKLDSNKIYKFGCHLTGFLTNYHKFSIEGFDTLNHFYFDFEMNLKIDLWPVHLTVYLPEKMFKKNSVTPTSKLKSALKQIAGTMDENPTLIIQIAGHSGYDETLGNDTLLSYKRAEKVAHILLKKVEYKERMEVRGFGTSVPYITAKDSLELKKSMILNNENIQKLNSAASIKHAQQLNRRISISILRANFVPY